VRGPKMFGRSRSDMPSAKCSSVVVYIRDAENVMVRSANAVSFIFVFGSTAPMPGSLFGSGARRCSPATACARLRTPQ
jgi:hypothetical protein